MTVKGYSHECCSCDNEAPIGHVRLIDSDATRLIVMPHG